MLLRFFEQGVQGDEGTPGGSAEEAQKDAQRVVVLFDAVEVEVDRALRVGPRHLHDSQRRAVRADPPALSPFERPCGGRLSKTPEVRVPATR